MRRETISYLSKSPIYRLRLLLDSRLSSSSVAVAALCLLSAPLLSLLHQGVALGIAGFLQALGSRSLFSQAAVGLGFDPVYASVLNTTLGNIEVRGMAVAGPAGDALHWLLPGLFAPSDHVAAGAWVTALLTDGASLLAATLAMMGTEVIFLVLGLVLLSLGARPGWARRPVNVGMALLGVMLQARGMIGLLSLRLSPQDLEIMGVAHIFTKVFPMDSQAYGQLTQEPWFVTVARLAPLGLVLAIYGALLVLAAVRRPRGGRGLAPLLNVILTPMDHWRRRSQRLNHVLALVTVPALGVLFLQGFFPSAINYDYPATAAQEMDVPEASATVEPEAVVLAATATPTPPPASPVVAAEVVGPSTVAIHGASYIYSYTVNGRPQRIQGVGYNVVHADLDLSSRISRYNSDFYQMRKAGVNTILGWEEKNFDEMTLNKAQEFGLGVVMPYYLPAHGDYGNPSYERQVRKDVLDWVRRYRNYPALRMWGLGNEVLHGMSATWDPKRAKAFAEFYIRLIDAVHALDPDHPVTYRDAEDVYLEPMQAAYLKDGVHRPWFVYGINFFTPRLEEALRDWPKKGMDVPLMVSEFGPSGLTLEDRPEGFMRMWRWIARHRNPVLGGFVYVWATRGPEAIDRVMGLTDEDSMPVDGSLSAFQKAFTRRAASPAITK